MTKPLANYKVGDKVFYAPYGHKSKGWMENSRSAVVKEVGKNHVLVALVNYKNNKATEKTKEEGHVKITNPEKIFQFLKGGKSTRKLKRKSRMTRRRR